MAVHPIMASIRIKKSKLPQFKPIKKKYKIYDLSNKDDRKEFSHALTTDTFALIKIPDRYKPSLSYLFDIFGKIFQSNKPLQCDEQRQYVGYTSTLHLKQSLWFYLDYEHKSLFPNIKNKKSIFYQNNNDKKVYDAFTNYNDIAKDALHALLQHQCKDKQSYIQCWNNLFPKNKMNAKRVETTDNKNDDNDIDMKDDNKTDHKNNADDDDQKYPESAVYHQCRKVHNLSLNNLAAIQYFGDKNKKRKRSLLEKMKRKSIDKKDGGVGAAVPCEEHMDYTLITMVMANEAGLQVRDIMNFEWIDLEHILNEQKVDRKDVLFVMTGLSLGTLLHDRVSCYHSVKNAFKSNDRISFPLFCYADPNGILDTNLIRPNFDFKITLKDQRKISCSQYLAKNMHPSVNW